MKSIVKTVYEADDGTIFQDQVLCHDYEEKKKAREKATTYWCIISGPDLTEGRGYYYSEYIKLYFPGSYPDVELMMEDWCYRKHGRPLSFIMGVSPIPNWRMNKTDAILYETASPTYIGSSRGKSVKKYLVNGPKDQGLIEGVEE